MTENANYGTCARCGAEGFVEWTGDELMCLDCVDLEKLSAPPTFSKSAVYPEPETLEDAVTALRQAITGSENADHRRQAWGALTYLEQRARAWENYELGGLITEDVSDE